jgi:4-amino-4-deoxy-L-arabinose transferase-like glycosyltransferase
MSERRAFWLLAACALAVFCWRLLTVPALGITLYIDEAYYWGWSQHLAWGYFSKPPLIAVLIAASTALFGDGVLGIKVLTMCCYPAAALIAFALGRRLYDAETGLWAGLAILTLPIFDWLGLFVSTDAPLVLFWTLGLLAYERARANDRLVDWLLLGVVCGLGLLAKYTMLVWLGCVFAHLALCDRARLRRPGPWLVALVGLLMLTPNLWWNYVNDFPTLHHTAAITVNKKASGGFSHVGEFVGAQWLAFGPLLGSAFLVLLWRLPGLWRDARVRLLLCFSLPLWGIVVIQAWRASANANWAAPAFVPAALLLAGWLLGQEKQRLFAAALACNVVLAALCYHWPQLLSLAGQADSSKLDPYQRARGWDRVAVQLRPLLLAHPQALMVADSRTVLAHLVYELRDLDRPYASWNPGGHLVDQYSLTTSLADRQGADLLFVSDAPAAPDVLKHAASAEELAVITTSLGRARSLTLYVYLLHGFTGY